MTKRQYIIIRSLGLIQSPRETRLFFALISTGFGPVTPPTIYIYNYTYIYIYIVISHGRLLSSKMQYGLHQLIHHTDTMKERI